MNDNNEKSGEKKLSYEFGGVEPITVAVVISFLETPNDTPPRLSHFGRDHMCGVLPFDRALNWKFQSDE